MADLLGLNTAGNRSGSNMVAPACARLGYELKVVAALGSACSVPVGVVGKLSWHITVQDGSCPAAAECRMSLGL